MKFASSLALLAAASTAYATSNPLIQARQAHARRGLIDVCAALDVDLAIASILQNGKPLVTGHLDLCLCVSVIPTFIKANIAAQAAVLLVGEAQVTAIVEALINAADGHQTCNYPDHSQAICDVKTPCGFSCTDGFVPYPANNPTQCVCPAPSTQCNGKCGSFPNGCGSAAPVRRRSILPRCSPEHDVCGVPGGSKGKGYECVLTTRDVESCGGCLSDSPFGSTTKRGVNCRSLPHVSQADCNNGACVIIACTDGYTPSAAKDACVLNKREIGAGLVEGAVAVVDPLVAVAEGGAVGVSALRRDVGAGVVEGVVAVVDPLVAVAEAGAVGVGIHRRDVGAGLVEGAVAVVDPLVAVAEAGAVGVGIHRRDAGLGVVEGAAAVVKPLVAVAEAGAVGVGIGHRAVGLGAAEGAVAVVKPVAAVAEGAVVGVGIL